MSDRFDLDRELGSYFEGRIASRPPEGLLEAALDRVAHVRQRPAWASLDAWLRPSQTRQLRTVGVALVVVALLLTLLVALSLVAGSHRPAPPFGPARAGLIAFDLDGDIYVANPDGTGRRQLTSGPDYDNQATFSPDGTLLAYESRLANGDGQGMVVMAPDGRGRVVVAEGLGNIGNPVWAPDSRRLAFSARLGGDQYQLFTAGLDHPSAIPLGPPGLHGQDPVWSPNGTEIAFKRIAPCCLAPANTLWLIGVDGSNGHQLSELGGCCNALWNTAWSPDGRRLAFLAQKPGDKNGRFDVYVIGEDGRGITDISDSPDDEAWPSWSPDGSRVAFVRMSPTGKNEGTLVVVALNGGPRIEFPGTWVNSNTPVWSPDGMRVAAYEKSPDEAADQNDAIAIFDLSTQAPPAIVPAANFSSATWQRLAP